jgi:hypothetical protein
VTDTQRQTNPSRLAKASVWLALAGFTGPLTALFVGQYLGSAKNAIVGQRVGLGLFRLCEMTALAGGFAARDRPPGKVG